MFAPSENDVVALLKEELEGAPHSLCGHDNLNPNIGILINTFY